MAGFYRFSGAAIAALCCALTLPPCIAQGSPDSSTAATEAQPSEAPPPEVSRQQWLERLQQDKQRAKEVALDHRLHPEHYAPTPKDAARAASERVLNDDSLQPGDIVSTDKGLFVFRGSADQSPKVEDFVPLPKR